MMIQPERTYMFGLTMIKLHPYHSEYGFKIIRYTLLIAKAEFPLLTGYKVGKAGKAFPSCIQEDLDCKYSSNTEPNLLFTLNSELEHKCYNVDITVT